MLSFFENKILACPQLDWGACPQLDWGACPQLD